MGVDTGIAAEFITHLMLLHASRVQNASFSGVSRLGPLLREGWRNGFVFCYGGGGGGACWGGWPAEEARSHRSCDLGCSCGCAREWRCRAICVVFGGDAVCGGGCAEAECGRGVAVEGVAVGERGTRCGVDCSLSAAWRYGSGSV